MIVVKMFFEKMIVITLACDFTVKIGIMLPLTNPITVQAEDMSTSISCDGVGMCKKTECVAGVCDTSPTNSSNIIHKSINPVAKS
jgi:hypothetical protein